MTREEYLDAVVEVTGGEAWVTIQEGLEEDIRNLQVRALQAGTWEEVVDLQGQAKVFVQFYNMRESAKFEKSQNAV